VPHNKYITAVLGNWGWVLIDPWLKCKINVDDNAIFKFRDLPTGHRHI